MQKQTKYVRLSLVPCSFEIIEICIDEATAHFL